MEQMLQKMMKRFPVFIVMGAMIVVVALIIGAVNSANAAEYYAIDKATRESSTALAATRAGVESTIIWLPYFKFLGVAMIMSGIVMALGVIATKLQQLGKEVMASVPESARVAIPPRPRSVMWMRLTMVLGMMIILIGFIVALVTAANASALFSNPITTIDAAATGSPLLAQLASIHSAEAWLEAFKFVGVALFFISIINGLSTIIFALRYQQTAIPEMVDHLPADVDVVTAPAAGD
jgi:hypothetical protein